MDQKFRLSKCIFLKFLFHSCFCFSQCQPAVLKAAATITNLFFVYLPRDFLGICKAIFIPLTHKLFIWTVIYSICYSFFLKVFSIFM